MTGKQMAALLVVVVGLCGVVWGCGSRPASAPKAEATQVAALVEAPVPTMVEEVAKYKGLKPKQWGEQVDGVLSRVPTKEKVIFLTFDACGGPYGSGYDQKLLDFLNKEKVEATLFLNSRWLETNPELAKKLAANPLFSLQNHGTLHRPLCVNGRSVYKIQGTRSVAEVYEEIMGTDARLKQLTGKRPRFFRSGTAYYDEIAVQVAQDLGYTITGFDILGDAGATYSKAQIIKVALAARPGTIIIYHMNQPRSATSIGVPEVVKNLRAAGYEFKKLEDYWPVKAQS
jgi:peptidoglycan/xylan/chitin deacetylase (PgdA/CDA1 family)